MEGVAAGRRHVMTPVHWIPASVPLPANCCRRGRRFEKSILGSTRVFFTGPKVQSLPPGVPVAGPYWASRPGYSIVVAVDAVDAAARTPSRVRRRTQADDDGESHEHRRQTQWSTRRPVGWPMAMNEHQGSLSEPGTEGVSCEPVPAGAAGPSSREDGWRGDGLAGAVAVCSSVTTLYRTPANNFKHKPSRTLYLVLTQGLWMIKMLTSVSVLADSGSGADLVAPLLLDVSLLSGRARVDRARPQSHTFRVADIWYLRPCIDLARAGALRGREHIAEGGWMRAGQGRPRRRVPRVHGRPVAVDGPVRLWPDRRPRPR